MSQPSEFVTPDLGQLHVRTLQEGFALVGVLHFDPSFQVEEEAAYVAVLDAGRVYISRQKVDGPIERDDAWDVGDAMQKNVWRKTTDQRALIVRFLKAFPEDNGWTVFGPSLHPAPTTNSNQWWGVSAGGRLTNVKDPPTTFGLAISQVLTTLPIWRNRQGEEHVLHSGPSWTGPLYDRAHRLMAMSVISDALKKNLQDVLRGDPDLRKVSTNTDRVFCQALNAGGYHLRPEVDYTQKVYGVMSKKEYEAENSAMRDQISEVLDVVNFKPKGFSI